MRLLDEHQNGADRSRKIFMVWMFLIWYRMYFVEQAPPTNWRFSEGAEPPLKEI